MRGEVKERIMSREIARLENEIYISVRFNNTRKLRSSYAERFTPVSPREVLLL